MIPIFRHVQETMISNNMTIIKNYLYIDIMFMHHTGTCIEISCEKMRRYHKNRITVNMYDKEYDSLPIEYIEDVYGPDWKTPKREKPS